jgi:hypothetical protein
MIYDTFYDFSIVLSDRLTVKVCCIQSCCKNYVFNCVAGAVYPSSGRSLFHSLSGRANRGQTSHQTRAEFLRESTKVPQTIHP